MTAVQPQPVPNPRATVDLSGLSAFTLSPVRTDPHSGRQTVDTGAIKRIVTQAVAGGADSLGVLGSTGSYAYLDRAERATVLEAAIASAKGVPVIAGVGAIGTAQVVDCALDAHHAGAAALLVPVMAYQQPTADEVVELYTAVSEATPLPIVVYDNPATTHFSFTDELYARVARVPGVISIKIPPTRLPDGFQAALGSISDLRATLPAGVSLGISGDWASVRGILAGCTTWYSTLAGTVTKPLAKILRRAQAGWAGDVAAAQKAQAASDRLEKLWELCQRYGSFRVTATIAEILELTPADSVPAPLHTLQGKPRQAIVKIVQKLGW